ncbi:MAG: site-2 protease family protein [Candidatus Levybacteria bacterium CG10_big_fil_rev_8_21_14_0_10_35_13]|nr:MAG: site-2 protease family protein [Candidatus Levybacteria bacterium CG10_big_fil_rev_8_21_14_0_10_35_13]
MDLTLGLVSLLVLIYSAILHEIAHGFVAYRLGDPTAKLMGRLTLDPRSHIDPVMSILLPLVLILSGSPIIFGAAKPVPVDPFNLRDGRKDMALVSLAGPATNFLLAGVAALLIKLLGFVPLGTEAELLSGWFLLIVVRLNLLLGIFNLLPIPPLDGSKIFALLLPEKEAAAYLSIGMVGIFILFFLLLFPIGGFSLGQVIFNLLIFAEGILGL